MKCPLPGQDSISATSLNGEADVTAGQDVSGRVIGLWKVPGNEREMELN